MSKPKLGRYLEWHGNRIRVVVRVPDSLIPAMGVTKLREVLVTDRPLEAEREKVDVVRRLKAKLRGEKVNVVQAPLTDEAMQWREAIQQAEISQDDHEPINVREALDARVDRITAKDGHAAANAFAAVATGAATPIASLLDRRFAEKDYTIGYMEDIRRAVGRLEQWCKDTATVPSVEAITTAVAGRFIHDLYIGPKKDVGTANKDISSLHAHWRYLKKRHGVGANPWQDQRLVKPKQRQEAASDRKRAFTDGEARTLLNGIRLRLEWQFSFMAILSGLRVHEIAGLRVKDCTDGRIAVTKSKTPSGVRTFPAHALLAPLIANRTKGKRPDEWLFEELPDQSITSKRDRSAPVSQAFTRERRRLEIEEKASDKQRQSNIDFHSWRRWFIRRAMQAHLDGATGYSFWTIADVVGHKSEGGSIDGVRLPLGMTIGHYAGKASWEAMTACINAVGLPEGVAVAREGLLRDVAGGRGLKRRKVPDIPQAAE